jgi:predicted HD phosphohydrolase
MAMETVRFIHMEDGSEAEYRFLEGIENAFAARVGDRVLDHLRGLDGSLGGYQVSRLGHSLQTATRARRDGADEEMVVAALLHDVGDLLATRNHGDMAAAILKPYVSERTHWIVAHHGIFQAYYYAHHLGGDRDARDRYRDHPHYRATVDFCHRWDQAAFDPDYDTLPLEAFEPAVHRIFARQPFADTTRGGD